jgi:hypothetical protein
MPALVTFRDLDPLYKQPFYNVSWSEHNKIGYVTKSGWVIYPLGCGLGKSRITTIEKRDHRIVPLPFEENSDKVEQLFTENKSNHKLFFQGIYTICNRDVLLFNNPIKLPIFAKLSAEEFDIKWEQLILLLRPTDTIMTFDTLSIISKTIAAIDHGVWSHTAGSIGGGKIVEATIYGVVERPISVYRSRRFRIGLYRSKHYNENDQKAQANYISFTRSMIGRPYGYRQLCAVAVNKLLRLKRDDDWRYTSPNDLAINQNLELIFTI